MLVLFASLTCSNQVSFFFRDSPLSFALALLALAIFSACSAASVRDRNRQIAGTHSAIVMSPSDLLWEYIQLMPTSKIEFALTTLSKEVAVVKFGALAL